MGLLSFLFPKQSQSSPSFRRVDWHRTEASLSQIAASADGGQAEWKQALIQADMLIDGILKEAGVAGQTMGERLKNSATHMSKTVYNQLWQAHKKRNELVHESGSFVAEWERDQYLAAFRKAVSELRGRK